LKKLHAFFREAPFVLLNVNVQEDAAKVSRFAAREGLSFPILLDRRGRVALQYGVRAHPAAFLIDIEGNLIGIALGFREWDREEMKALISSLVPKG
jgi:peroxiredoxin